MTVKRENIKAFVIKFFLEQTDKNFDSKLGTNFEELGVDSVYIMLLVDEIEEKYKINVSMEELESVKNLDRFIDYLCAKM